MKKITYPLVIVCAVVAFMGPVALKMYSARKSLEIQEQDTQAMENLTIPLDIVRDIEIDAGINKITFKLCDGPSDYRCRHIYDRPVSKFVAIEKTNVDNFTIRHDDGTQTSYAGRYTDNTELLQIHGGTVYKYFRIKEEEYWIDDSQPYHVYFVDREEGYTVVRLPFRPSHGWSIDIKDMSGHAGDYPISIYRDNDAAHLYIINHNYGAVTVEFDGEEGYTLK